MTDEPGEALRRELVAHLAKKGMSALVCPVCKSTQWGVQGVVQESIASAYVPGALPIPDVTRGVMPLVVVACSNCGYVRQFAYNAIKGAANK